MIAVAVAMSDGGGDFTQDCHQCHDEGLRKQWGCDAPTDEPQFWIGPCVWCYGRNATCTHCAGDNRIAVHRCPHALATPALVDVVQTVALAEQGILPDVGGWVDQATTWVQAFPVVSNEIARTRARKQEQAAKRQQSKQRGGR